MHRFQETATYWPNTVMVLNAYDEGLGIRTVQARLVTRKLERYGYILMSQHQNATNRWTDRIPTQILQVTDDRR